MTNAQLEAIFKQGNITSPGTGLAAVYTAGYYAGKGTTVPATPVAPSHAGQTAPTNIPNLSHAGDK